MINDSFNLPLRELLISQFGVQGKQILFLTVFFFFRHGFMSLQMSKCITENGSIYATQLFVTRTDCPIKNVIVKLE